MNSIFINKNDKCFIAPTKAHAIAEKIFYMLKNSNLSILEQQGTLKIVDMAIINDWIKIVNKDKLFFGD